MIIIFYTYYETIMYNLYSFVVNPFKSNPFVQFSRICYTLKTKFQCCLLLLWGEFEGRLPPRAARKLNTIV